MPCFRISLFLLGIIAVIVGICRAEGIPENQKKNIAVTGIVLVSDHPCANGHSPDPFCGASNFALVSGRTIYLLYGDAPTLQKFGHQRVKVSGVFEAGPVVSYGMHSVRRKISVRAIASEGLLESKIEGLVDQLAFVPWRGPENHCSPMCWEFAFTDPMVKILQAGRGAQGVLLRHIGDEKIKDQVVMLLGGVADENAIPAIIDAMPDVDQGRPDPNAKRLNVIANLALTNLTVSEVIWHHGGGISPDKCPDDPKSCWWKWWNDHKDSFRVGVGGDRLYTNYPNYGIYAQF